MTFTSIRERRLWTWTLIVVLAIYATLGLAGDLAGRLADRGMLDSAAFLCFLVVIIAILGIGLRGQRPGGWLGWVAVGVAGVYAMAVIRLGIDAAERTHLFEYGLVAALVFEALRERRANGRSVPAPAVSAFVGTAILGGLDEGIQALLPDRVYDPVDIGFNALAAFMGIAAVATLSFARDRLAGGRAR